MRPGLIKKIQALADDERGDPSTRARAQEKLAAYRVSHPHLFEPPKPKFHDVRQDRRVHGMRLDPAYEYYIFSDLSLWDQIKAGNRTHTVHHNGVNFRIVLFQHKRSPTWSWMRVSDAEGTVFSGRFKTIGEAQADSWKSLMEI